MSGSETFINEVLALEDQLNGASNERDFETIEQLYAPEFMLGVRLARFNLDTRRSSSLRRSPMKQTEVRRSIEVTYASGDVVVIMGSESLVWQDTGTDSDGKQMTRRFTNVWRQIDGDWKRIARHANNITS
jgi:ketosteroid isomerase-like protein